MKKLIVSLGLALTLSFGATLDEGVKAANKGDYKTALIIFEDLASKNNSVALYNLGVMYNNGHGVKQGYIKAKELYEKAALQGYVNAQYNLAVLYFNGQQIKQDKSIAKKWYGKACDGGDREACEMYNELSKEGF